MAPQRISPRSEAKITHGVERVVDLVGEGLDPNAALLKVAGEGNYLPGHVRLMVQAYNTGRTNYQRKAASDPFEKTASFPLADAAVVLNTLYPAQVKSAAAVEHENTVSDEYHSRPYWLERRQQLEKAARAVPPLPAKATPPYPRDPDFHSKKAHDLLADLERERNQRRSRVAAGREKLAGALNELDEWFQGSGRATVYPLVREQALLLCGAPAGLVLDKVALANSRLVKKGQASGKSCYGPINLEQQPWAGIAGCLGAARDYHREERSYQEFLKESTDKAAVLIQALLPPVAKPNRIQGSILSYEKRALLDVLTKTVPGVAATDAIRSVFNEFKPDDKDKLKSDAYLAVTDPDHEAQLRKIRTRSILHNLLANDDFLSAEPPHKVTDLYNKISHLSPRAAEQPILMQALLRRYLAQGQVDPHDLDQLVGIEHKLKAIDEPSRATNLPKLPGGNLVDKGGPSRRED